MNPLRIAIIGGGPGGLMTAYLLDQRLHIPFTATLYEASGRLGGKVVTRCFKAAPVTYEAGAAELYDYSQLGPDPLRELVAELGLVTCSMWGQSVFLGDRLLKDDADIRREFGPATSRALKRFNRQARAAISPAEYYESDWRRTMLTRCRAAASAPCWRAFPMRGRVAMSRSRSTATWRPSRIRPAPTMACKTT